jgi:hypothetical protein
VSGTSEYHTAHSLTLSCSQSKTGGEDTGIVKGAYWYAYRVSMLVCTIVTLALNDYISLRGDKLYYASVECWIETDASTP